MCIGPRTSWRVAGFVAAQSTLLALAFVVAGGCDDTPGGGGVGATQPSRPPATPVPPPAATAPAAAAAAYPAGARPSTQPGRIGAGDLLTVSVPDLSSSGAETVKVVRVEADGTIGLYYLTGPQHVAGLTPAEAEAAIAQAYNKENVVQHAAVYVRRLQVAGTSDVLPAGAIRPFDLVRVSVFDLVAPGSETVRVARVDGGGGISLAYVGRIMVGGQTAAGAERMIAEAYRTNNIVQHALVTVLRLEAAPDGAAKLDLPDVALGPVPDLLRPLFEPAPLGTPAPVPGPASAQRR